MAYFTQNNVSYNECHVGPMQFLSCHYDMTAFWGSENDNDGMPKLASAAPPIVTAA